MPFKDNVIRQWAGYWKDQYLKTEQHVKFQTQRANDAWNIIHTMKNGIPYSLNNWFKFFEDHKFDYEEFYWYSKYHNLQKECTRQREAAKFYKRSYDIVTDMYWKMYRTYNQFYDYNKRTLEQEQRIAYVMEKGKLQAQMEHNKEQNNVVPFKAPLPSTGDTTPPLNWLMNLPKKTNFLAKHNNHEIDLFEFIIISKTDNGCVCLELIYSGKMNEERWVDSADFCKHHTCAYILELGEE